MNPSLDNVSPVSKHGDNEGGSGSDDFDDDVEVGLVYDLFNVAPRKRKKYSDEPTKAEKADIVRMKAQGEKAITLAEKKTRLVFLINELPMTPKKNLNADHLVNHLPIEKKEGTLSVADVFKEFRNKTDFYSKNLVSSLGQAKLVLSNFLSSKYLGSAIKLKYQDEINWDNNLRVCSLMWRRDAEKELNDSENLTAVIYNETVLEPDFSEVKHLSSSNPKTNFILTLILKPTPY
jgi:hypothetical protein